MSRDDGFAIADIDTGLMHDPKVLSLARRQRDSLRTGASVSLFAALLLASWKAGRRLTLEETVPAWWLDETEELAADLVACDLIDAEHRCLEHAWEGYYTPAFLRREHYRELGAKGGRASVDARLNAGQPHAQPYGQPRPSVPPVPTGPTVRPSVPPDRPSIAPGFDSEPSFAASPDKRRHGSLPSRKGEDDDGEGYSKRRLPPKSEVFGGRAA